MMQAWVLLRLQWMLTLRSWSRGKTLAALVSAFMFLLALAGAALAAAGLYWVGAAIVPKQPPLLQLLLFDTLTLGYVFVVFWGMLIELQRNDLLDLRKLLHFPARPSLVFTINFLYSMLGPALLFFVSGGLAFFAGLATAYGPGVWLALPAAAAFFFMIAVWTYHFRGWFSTLMQNRRTRRAFAVLFPVIVVTLSQLPALINVAGIQQEDAAQWRALLDEPAVQQLLIQVHQVAPPLWLAWGLERLLANDIRTLALCAAGMTAISIAGLLLSYRGTLRYYRSAGISRSGVKARRNTRLRFPLTGRALPLLAQDTAAMTQAFFLDYSRHPAIRSQLIMPPIMTLIFCLSLTMGVRQGGAEWSGSVAPLFVLVLPFLGCTMMLFNVFGTDLRGFRGLVLLPAPRHRILLAKNLALFPFVGGMCLVVMAVAGVVLGTHPAALLLQFVQVPACYLLFCMLGNLLSVYAPMPLSRDALRATGGRMFLMFQGLAYAFVAVIALSPSIALLSASPHRITPEGYPMPILWWSSLALLAFTAILYRPLLNFAADQLTAKELDILRTLFKESR